MKPRILGTRGIAAAVAALALVLVSCGTDNGDGPAGSSEDPGGGAGTGAPEAPSELRITWWGGDSENAAINAVLDAYTESTGINVAREPLAWDGYWDRLATTTANQGAPDIVMQAGSQLPTYAGNGALVDLNSVANLNLAFIDEGLQPFGMVGDENFGVVAAANAMGLVANDQLLEEAGVTMPEGAWTWQDFADLARQISAGTPEGVYGTQDFGGDMINFILWVRHDGRDFYNDDGSLNATRDDVAEWFQFWDDLRAEGAAPPADVTAEGSGQGIPMAPLARGVAAMGQAWTQDLVAYFNAADYPYSMHLPPYTDENPTLWMNAASLWSISTSSDHPEASADLINYMISDEQAIELMGMSLGLPPSETSRSQLADEMSHGEQVAAEFMDVVAEHQKPLNRLWPASFAPLRTLMGELNEAIAFGSMSVDEAADQFMQEAESIGN